MTIHRSSRMAILLIALAFAVAGCSGVRDNFWGKDRSDTYGVPRDQYGNPVLDEADKSR